MQERDLRRWSSSSEKAAHFRTDYRGRESEDFCFSLAIFRYLGRPPSLECDREVSVMSEWRITYRGTVYPWHCDHMGHMNVMWYASKFDEACWQLLALLGLDRRRFEEDATGMVAVEQQINYKRELRAGETVTIQSTLLQVKNKSVHMLHKMLSDETEEIAATTLVVGVHIDAKTREAIRLPEDVCARAAEKIISQKQFGDFLLQSLDVPERSATEPGATIQNLEKLVV